MNDLYFVYAIDQNGNVKGEKRVTDKEHLEKCAKIVRSDFNVKEAHYNKAAMCFDGYLTQGDYCGTLKEEEHKDKLSPVLIRYYELKAKHPDAILLFRIGDFYETYKDDAKETSQILGITLTKSMRQKEEDGKGLRMASFPYHALDTYLPKLIRAGKRVAIIEN